MHRRAVLWLVAALLVVTGRNVYAHGVATHNNITQAAIDYVKRVHSQIFACADSLGEVLFGAEAEDTENSDLFRPFFHFFPVLNVHGADVFAADCDSLEWGFVTGTLCTAKTSLTEHPRRNQHTWNDAIANTDSSRAWRELGYVLHLLEDLTSPAHTRNDDHFPKQVPLVYDELDPVEAIIRIPTHPPQQALVSLVAPQQAFRTLQAFVEANFFSRDTTFQYPPYLLSGETALQGPVMKTEDANYFYGACLPRPPGMVTWTDPACDSQGRRKIAHKGKQYYKNGQNRRFATINDVIAGEQFLELGPIAVFYSAVLIKHFYDIASPPVESCPSPPVAKDDTYLMVEGTTLTISAPGVLSNDTIPSGLQATIEFLPPFPLGGLTNVFPYNGGFILDLSTVPTFVGTISFDYLFHTSGNPSGDSNVASVTVNVVPSPSQPTWTQLFPSSSPSARNQYSMAYDAQRGEIVLFGGGLNETTLTPGNDTWVWDGNTWSQRFPFTSPPARSSHAMAYDAARGEVVLFGGFGISGFPNATLGDTWVWDGNNWTQKLPAASPPLRFAHAMTYDSVREEVVLFGGAVGGFGGDDDTWVWNGHNWAQRFPATRPPGRAHHDMTFDAQRGEVLMYSGSNISNYGARDTWSWNGVNWSQKVPSTSPNASWQYSLAYDARSNVVLLFGGADTTGHGVGETWVWNGEDWAQSAITLHPNIVEGGTHRLVYDDTRHGVIFFGSTHTGTFQPSTWLWRFGTP